MLPAKPLESLDLNSIRSDGYAFQIEMTYLAFKHGFRVSETPITFRERAHGHSKFSRALVWEAFWRTLQCHAPLPDILRHLRYLFEDYGELAAGDRRSG